MVFADTKTFEIFWPINPLLIVVAVAVLALAYFFIAAIIGPKPTRFKRK